MCYRYQHPNILELLGCFSDEGRYCLVYPYLPSGSLFQRLHHQVDLEFTCLPTEDVHPAVCPPQKACSCVRLVARSNAKTGSELTVDECTVV